MNQRCVIDVSDGQGHRVLPWLCRSRSRQFRILVKPRAAPTVLSCFCLARAPRPDRSPDAGTCMSFSSILIKTSHSSFVRPKLPTLENPIWPGVAPLVPGIAPTCQADTVRGKRGHRGNGELCHSLEDGRPGLPLVRVCVCGPAR